MAGYNMKGGYGMNGGGPAYAYFLADSLALTKKMSAIDVDDEDDFVDDVAGAAAAPAADGAAPAVSGTGGGTRTKGVGTRATRAAGAGDGDDENEDGAGGANDTHYAPQLRLAANADFANLVSIRRCARHAVCSAAALWAACTL